ncbi:MAG: RHS repeat-associated core domain-containing protein, partial [Desulfobacterales bacterium]
LGRRITAEYPAVSAPCMVINSIDTEYDENGNVTKITGTKTDGTASTVTDITVNSYDSFDRLLSSAQRDEVTVSCAYDNNGNRTEVSTASGTTYYTYDSRNRLETARAGGLTASYTYYPDGKKHRISYPNMTDVTYNWHPSDRVASVRHEYGTAVFSEYTYTYDANGSRTRQTELQNGVTRTTDYSYDDADRLTEFTVRTGTDTESTQYTFEGYNRKSETVTENGITVKSRTYAYDETDRITSVTDDTDPDSPQTVTYACDRNGNTVLKSDSRIADGDITFVYDSRDQLVQVTRGPPENRTLLGQYDYNYAGLRVRQRFGDRGNTDYFYDGSAVIEERDAVTKSLTARYRYADRLISLDTGTEKQYCHHDALGSTVNLTDQAGNVQVSYLLDPWGNVTQQTGGSVNRQIFTGKEHDGNTGLIYFGARYYDPEIARFLTQDAYLGEQGTPPSLHRYLYAYSNPTAYIDLYGNIACLAELRDEINEWSEEKYKAAEELNNSDSDLRFAGSGLIGIGAGMGELAAGGVSTFNYFANWASQLTGGFGNADWAEEHASELGNSHEIISNVYDVISTSEGREQLSVSAFDTIASVAKGNTGAIAKTTGFFGQIGAGGAASKVTGAGLGRILGTVRPSIAPMRQTLNTTVSTAGRGVKNGVQNVRHSVVNKINSFFLQQRVDPRIRINLFKRKDWKFSIGAEIDKINNPKDVGHAFIVLDSPTGKRTVRGLWPVTASGVRGFDNVIDPLRGMKGGLFNDFDFLNNPNTVLKSYNITGTQARKILKYISQTQKELKYGKNYQLLTNQCTTFAVGAAKEAGIRVNAGLIKNPKRLYRTIGGK